MEKNIGFRVCLMGGYRQKDVDQALVCIHQTHVSQMREVEQNYESLKKEYDTLHQEYTQLMDALKKLIQ